LLSRTKGNSSNVDFHYCGLMVQTAINLMLCVEQLVICPEGVNN
jgi:hypothetical protein